MSTRGCTFKYYPRVLTFAISQICNPSDKKFISLIEVEFIEKIGKIGTIGRIGTIGLRYPRLIDPINPIKRSAPIDPTKFHQAKCSYRSYNKRG